MRYTVVILYLYNVLVLYRLISVNGEGVSGVSIAAAFGEMKNSHENDVLGRGVGTYNIRVRRIRFERIRTYSTSTYP